ncbi:MAG TPA: FAD-dependent oxidoreductase [Polyangiaceae bacterium]
MESITNNQSLDYVIIGGGPAGLQAAYFLAKANLRVLVLERAAEVGAFFRQYPRHRKLISINKVYTGVSDPETNMRWDWNSLLSDEYAPLFKDFSKEYFPAADTILEYLRCFAEQHRLPVELNVSVSRVERTEAGFEIHAEDGRTWRAPRVVVATGMSRENVPPIPGVELCERYSTMSLDQGDFTNQKVLIVGKGNSAFETADHLTPSAAVIHLASPRPLRMAWRTHFVGDLRAVNNNVLDTYQLKLQNAIIDAEIAEIRHNGKGFSVDIRYSHADGEVETLYYDRVLLCTGFRFDTSFFADSCMPAMTSCGRLPLQTSAWESPNVPGLFFAGTVMQQRDHKKYMSAFIHGFRYNVQALAHHLLASHHDIAWPQQQLTFSARGIAKGLLGEMNQSSAIWQQPGFLCNLVVLDVEQRSARLFAHMPMDYVHDRFARGMTLALTLEYGPHQPDPFNIDRVHRSDVDRAAESTFLHPVIRRFEDGVLVDEHHVLEDLAAEWLEPEHINPLVQYLQNALTLNSSITAIREADAETELATATG